MQMIDLNVGMCWLIAIELDGGLMDVLFVLETWMKKLEF